MHAIKMKIAGRRAWLHVVSGEVALRDLILTSGDAVGVSAEHAVSFTVRSESEVLLADVT